MVGIIGYQNQKGSRIGNKSGIHSAFAKSGVKLLRKLKLRCPGTSPAYKPWRKLGISNQLCQDGDERSASVGQELGLLRISRVFNGVSTIAGQNICSCNLQRIVVQCSCWFRGGQPRTNYCDQQGDG